MTELESRYANAEKHIFFCDCGDWHYISVDWDEDPEWRFLEICDTYWPRRFRDRLKAAFRVLRGEPHYAKTIALDEKNVSDLLEVLSKHSKQIKLA